VEPQAAMLHRRLRAGGKNDETRRSGRDETHGA
jgi:hypothetical protein